MAKSFNWAILAPGKIAHNFIADLKFVPNAKVIAVASRSLDRANSFAKQYHIEHAVGSYEALLKIPDIDCVYIASPHVFHHPQTLMCLEAGLNVLCEKPFAMNLGQVDEMISKAKENNAFLMEAMWTRFFPWIGNVQQILRDGAIGDIRSLKADFGFKATFNPESRLFNKALGGGALLDIGIYPLFAALLFMGYPNEIEAKAEIGVTGVDSSIDFTFLYSDGRKAHLYATVKKQTNNECIIEGTDGRIEIEPRFHESKGFRLVRGSEEKYFDFGFEGKGYRWEIEHVQDCILKGKKESPLMTLDNSRDLIRLLDEVRHKIGLTYS